MAVLQAPTAPAVPQSASNRAWAVYYRYRAEIETPENIGRLVLIDLNSGDYEIANDDLGFDAAANVRGRHPDADVFALRIGYDAVDVIGGVLERLEN